MPKLSFYCTEEGKVSRPDCNYHLEKRLFNFVVKSEKARQKGNKEECDFLLTAFRKRQVLLKEDVDGSLHKLIIGN